MNAFYAEFTALPGCAAKVMSLLNQLTRHVRRKPSNLVFSAYRRSGCTDTSIVFEQYADENALNAHVTAPDTVRFNTDLLSLVERQCPVLNWLTPC